MKANERRVAAGEEPEHEEPQATYTRTMAAWHGQLKVKYQRAARYPWLPVAPDPPEPE